MIAAGTCVGLFFQNRKDESEDTSIDVIDVKENERFKKGIMSAVAIFAFPTQLVFFSFMLANGYGRKYCAYFNHSKELSAWRTCLFIPRDFENTWNENNYLQFYSLWWSQASSFLLLLTSCTSTMCTGTDCDSSKHTSSTTRYVILRVRILFLKNIFRWA